MSFMDDIRALANIGGGAAAKASHLRQRARWREGSGDSEGAANLRQAAEKYDQIAKDAGVGTRRRIRRGE